MKKILFYCQHILGIGHLIRSMEIVRGLLSEFQVCFINGGEAIKNFQFPDGVEVIHLPPIKTDSEFQQLQVPEVFESVEDALEFRRDILLSVYDRIKPDILIIELFPFGRRRFSTELVPLLEIAKENGTKTVSSLRDIVVTKQDKVRHEQKVCKLMNRYFDLLLVHGDPKFIPLEESFSRVQDLQCEVRYTGYVAQPLSTQLKTDKKPTILVSVGGGRFGHELLECVVETAPILQQKLPQYHIQMFTGPFSPSELFDKLQTLASSQSNLTIEQYTPDLVSYMQQAELSISMSGYNTTMNILKTGVRAMMKPFTGNGDLEQTIRVENLEKMGIVQVIRPEDLDHKTFANKVINYLNQTPQNANFDFNGVEKTTAALRELVIQNQVAA